MRALLLLSTALLGSCATGPTERQDLYLSGLRTPWSRMGIGVGVRQLDDLAGGDDARVFSIEFEEGDAIGPVRFEGGLHYGQAQRTVRTTGGVEELGTELAEFSVGVRSDLQHPSVPLVPYLGGGVSLTYARSERVDGNLVVRDDDFAVGSYVKAGLGIRLERQGILSLEVRRVLTDDFTLGPVTVSGDATQFALIFSAGGLGGR